VGLDCGRAVWPDIVNDVTRWSEFRGWRRRLSGFRQEAEQLTAGRVEGALLGFRLAMGEQRPTLVADKGENDLLDWPPAEVAIDLQSTDDLTAESPDVVAVSAPGLARQLQGQQLAQERLEAFHHPPAGCRVARLIRPTARPLIEVRTVSLQGVGGSRLRW